MALSDKRQQWLRGAYLDRITETAMHFAEGRTYFVDAEWLDYIGDEFGYLTELTAEDHAYLRGQAGLEAFRRIVVALSAAREAAFVMLRVDNSDVVNVESRFAIGIGWVGLLQHAADRLRTYPKEWNAALTGGKEKFGCCVLYVDCDYGARGCRSEVERLREEVRLRSLSTCEVCGNAGRLRLAGFAKTVCDKHVGILGDLREDDGLWADPWKWHEDGDEYPSEAAEQLTGMAPARLRPTEHVIDLFKLSDLGKRIDEDTWKRSGREQDLLIEFGYAIEEAAKGSAVKVEHLDKYVRDEIAGWRSVQPLSDSDREFLRGYLRALIDWEYARVRTVQERRIADLTLSDIGKQIHDDILKRLERYGLLVQFAGELETAVTAALTVADEDVDVWLRDEVERLHGVQPLSDEERDWLHRYLRNLVIDEGVRRKRQS